MADPEVTFLGAAGTVTGSCFLLSVGGERILIDCGLFQGSRTIEALNREPFAFDPRKVAAAIDDTTRAALASEKPATLATYRMELGDKFIPVKNVFVPLWIKGRRWGNFELAYRDE